MTDAPAPTPLPSWSRGSLFEKLWGPLKNRGKATFAIDVFSEYGEDTSYVQGLYEALELDLAAGAMNPETLQTVFTTSIEQLGAPRRARGPDGVKQGFDDLDLDRWATPDQPWVDVPQADPRERLLARMIHAGADPWHRNTERWPIGANATVALMARDYVSLVGLCLRLPGAREEGALEAKANLTLNREFITRTTLQEAVDQPAPLLLIERLLAMGASTDATLQLARSAQVVKALMAHGARMDASSVDVLKTWSDTRDAATLRELIAASADQTDPAERLKKALAGERWGPLKDALAETPDWQEQLVLDVDGTPLRAPLAMMLSESMASRPGRLRQALRLLTLAPPDDRELAPGLSERGLMRLAVAQAAAPVGYRLPKTDEQLRQDLQVWADRLGQGRPMVEEAAAWLRARLVDQDSSASRLASTVIEQGWIDDGPSNENVWPERTLEQVLLLGEAARKLLGQEGNGWTNQAAFQGLWGAKPDAFANPPPERHGEALAVLEALAEQAPERRQELIEACLYLLAAGLRAHTSATVLRQNVWDPIAQRLETWIVEGGASEAMVPAFVALKVVSERRDDAPACQRLAQAGPALVQQALLTQSTPSTNAARHAGPRL